MHSRGSNGGAQYLKQTLKTQFKRRGGAKAMVGISRSFRAMDASGDGTLDEEEFGNYSI
jgi:hypothetical protein